MKKILIYILVIAMLVIGSVGCNSSNEGSDDKNNSQSEGETVMTDNNTQKPTEKPTERPTDAPEVPKDRDELIASTEIVPTVYDVDAIKDADSTAAGSFEAWKKEIVKGGRNNDDPTENAVIHSPFHTLTVNGVDVPVYTVRCTTGVHSFAWIDIKGDDDFLLELELELSFNAAKCVVLPESRGTDAAFVGERKLLSYIGEEGSYTFTFEENINAKVTDPTLAPLTLMVSREENLLLPYGYTVREIAPGYHENDELKFRDERTVYVIKAGYHDISSISLPSNSILYIERGAYIQVTDRMNPDGSHNTDTAIHANYANHVSIISRGLLDCGKLQGGDHKYKHVVNTAHSKNISISGLTVVNSNTWTICAYSSENVRIDRNLLLAYRTYSDGIMMSECINSSGRYNFVRTGDDAIEFKGTGWWSAEGRVGTNCIYEYNDLWTDKGAGYCLTWEASCSMTGMTFRNNSVGFAQPTWTDRNTAIDCLLGTNPDSVWSDIVFENIEIYHVISPNAINMQIQGEGGNLENITFKNIKVSNAKNWVYAFRMHFSAKGGSISGVVLDNVEFCGSKLTAEDVSDPGLFCNQANRFFGNITVK